MQSGIKGTETDRKSEKRRGSGFRFSGVGSRGARLPGFDRLSEKKRRRKDNSMGVTLKERFSGGEGVGGRIRRRGYCEWVETSRVV